MTGLSICGKIGKIPESVGIDTWGVDYVLLDRDKKPLLPAFSYRDNERAKAAEEVSQVISHRELYKRTGIQYQGFNTVYQLFCDKKSGRLEKARHFMQIPDYLAFRLTGEIVNEYTNATTTSLVNAFTSDWDAQILDALGIDRSIFSPLSQPCRNIGKFLPETAEKVGYMSRVVAVPSHDTASAFALACTPGGSSAVISSGTWSLVGTEIDRPCISERALRANFTNEGGIDGSFRFLKNIMGTWIIQQIHKEAAPESSFDELMELARASDYDRTFDIHSPTLLSPESMTEAVRALLGESALSLGDLLSSVYITLATSYRDTVDEIETIVGRKIDSIRIVGGGSVDRYLNELTERISGRTVTAGPKEATALGNILAQIMYSCRLDRKSAIEALGA